MRGRTVDAYGAFGSLEQARLVLSSADRVVESMDLTWSAVDGAIEWVASGQLRRVVADRMEPGDRGTLSIQMRIGNNRDAPPK